MENTTNQIDSNQPLTIKYRPDTFSKVVEQTHIIDILRAQLQNPELRSANYIFFGPRGTGKTTTARLLAKSLNCLDLKDGDPCNKCENCVMINSGKSIDIVEIDAASHTGVDNVREEIIDKALYQPASLKKKVYIIDEVHQLSKGAFNALLKIMEEPPHYLMFILATTDVHKVPETIMSRCQIFNFKMIPLLENVERLKEICDAENIKWTKEGLEIIAKLSEGSMRDSIKYLDQVSIVDEVNPVNCSRLLGVAGNQQIENFMDSIITQKFSDAYSILDSVEENGVSIETFVKQMITFLDENFSKYQADFLMLTNLIKRFLENSKFFTRHKVLLKAEIGGIFNVDTQKSTSQNLKEVVVREDKPKNEKKVSSTTYSDNKPIVQPQDNSISDTPESKEDKTQSQNIEPKEKLENSGNYDLEDIKKKMISKMVSKSLVSQLESSTHISSIAGSTIKIQVIGKMLFDHLKNHETNSKIVSAFNDILGGDYQIELEQISKEDFLAQHSGGLF